MSQSTNAVFVESQCTMTSSIAVGVVLRAICDNLKDKKMKTFKKLETGLWTYIDKTGHVHVLTEEEFINFNQIGLWWSVIKKKYFKI